MSEEILTMENLMGSNARERINNVMMQEILVDEETKVLFDEFCEEIAESDLTDVELVEMIKVFPHNLKTLLAANVKNRDIDKLFRQAEYDEFILDFKSIDKKGENGFEKRYSKIRTVDFKKFLKKRILTREEIEFLISEVTKKSGLVNLSYKESHETYSGPNVYLVGLIKAHKSLSESKQTQARRKITEIVNKILLRNVLQEVREFNNANVIKK